MQEKNHDQVSVKIYNLSWLVIPLGFCLLYEGLFNTFAPAFADADLDLLLYQAALLVAVVGFVSLFRKTRVAGWRKPNGLSWIFVAAPLWLAVISPLGLITGDSIANPPRVFIWIMISLFVAINEETIFRGFILRGMMRSMNPMTALVASSMAFGLLHFLNLFAAGDPVFVGAQMVSAAGVGAVAAAMTLRCGSIIPAAVLHFLVDAIGLTAIGGFDEAIQSRELAPSLVVTGLVFFVWGIFWSWRAIRAGKVNH